MKRRVPNRRRLFVQNLENRRVLAGCMGVDAATDDLATNDTDETDVDSEPVDDTEDEASSLCLIHEELESIFAELGSRDLADAQIYILI
ncbi:hypothetical protein [Rhodopirellula sp. P2]|uniref:hypothetical protein n=1 Tax=Rhodopirellula sp. P2 TaxID=2127060 RepID=UPI00236837FE|nr:hypothetical protein [Rhodopirellula sp. P2]WDQ15477.1 hypothetical protein PSR62_17750 [Rhodopirellula sp. P2]